MSKNFLSPLYSGFFKTFLDAIQIDETPLLVYDQSSKENTVTPLKLNAIDQQLLALALEEDLTPHLNEPSHYVDVTSNALFQHDNPQQSVAIISKANSDIVICGLPVIEAILNKLTPTFTLNTVYHDGDVLSPGQTLLTLHSDAKTLVMVERTLLNFLRHLSAIATLTKQFVRTVKYTRLNILDTRKTTPGFRHLEKYAVHCGGGMNHRMGLYDAFMIKDTHIDLLGGIQSVLEKIPLRHHNPLPVIVEVRTLEELKVVLEQGQQKVTRVLFDNMPLPLLKQCVDLAKPFFETEASGNINLMSIKAVAETGVNFASIGMLTYAAGQVDLSMIGIK
ncbi:MAG TPA: carboxylating nicotinate-nucleotide diphosphorylase [Coxiellaceae bacterium]|nr:carboxylating nicotinate-nucleotide diphosphorylase [Coxiellaceae bacterium]